MLARAVLGELIFAGMDANVLFGKALGLGSGWKVIKSEMDVAGQELKIWLDFESGSQFACPRCGKFCPVHDTVDKKWRHLDFWQHRTELIARVPRTNCEEHGILQAAVPWARPGSGFTLMMEAMILLLGQQMSVSATARQLGESDKRLWRVLEHYVMEAHGAKDWSQVRRLMIDEISARKGHRYVTVVLDAESHELLLMVEGRSAQAVTEFLAAMPAHGAKAEAITEVVMDMSPAYIAGVQAHFPNYGIIGELSTPGAILPGVAGAIALVLVLYMAAILPINVTGLILIGLAFALFVFDVFAPTHGVLTVGGIVAFLIGSLMLFNRDDPLFRLSLAYIIPATIITALFFAFIVGKGLRAQFLPIKAGRRAMDRAQASQLGCAVYRRRRPERTRLYRAVQGHFETYSRLSARGASTPKRCLYM